ncbi:hypothetical protein AYI70_g2111 [Smittium culicis]|uniref:DNA damage-inducible protein 1 n=1 Tax=Smittium culicis TaxID=133412 RepID=A0A1R1YAI0_9FUNG|nr:hypothetical protein AYI70_g2111 [Smittium culicis]
MNTNCRGLIKLFKERYWTVLDTGAACSVISSALMNEIDLEIDDKDTQTVVTADGSRHNTIGSISNLPIKIANYAFPCDTLVLELSKPLIILGTDWFSRYNAVIDLKSKELVLEKPKVDVVMKLYTSKPNKRVYD